MKSSNFFNHWRSGTETYSRSAAKPESTLFVLSAHLDNRYRMGARRRNKQFNINLNPSFAVRKEFSLGEFNRKEPNHNLLLRDKEAAIPEVDFDFDGLKDPDSQDLDDGIKSLPNRDSLIYLRHQNSILQKDNAEPEPVPAQFVSMPVVFILSNIRSSLETYTNSNPEFKESLASLKKEANYVESDLSDRVGSTYWRNISRLISCTSRPKCTRQHLKLTKKRTKNTST